MPKYECGVCREPNALANTHCVRCGLILPWGFLHDPSLIVVKKEKSPFWVPWFDAIFNINKKAPACRYCGETIVAEALVCPHCSSILMVRINQPIGPPALGGFVGSVMGSGAEISATPEMRALIERFLDDHPNVYGSVLLRFGARKNKSVAKKLLLLH